MMQIPKRVLVGRRDGKRVINWPVVLLLGLMVGFVSGGAGAATWFLLTKQFSLFAVVFPLFLSIGWFWGVAIRSGFSVPIEQLPSLDKRGELG
jgi:hypothetical protein